MKRSYLIWKMNKKTILVWFRNDLRICDNEVLSLANERAQAILPVFIYDSRLYSDTKYETRKTGVIRARFINESVQDLQRSIRSYQGELLIEKGLPEEIIPELVRRYDVDEVYHHREVAYEETQVSSLVEEALWKLRINLRHFIGHTLYHKEDLPFPIKDIPDEFNIFKNKTSRESSIRPCIPMPGDYKFLKGLYLVFSLNFRVLNCIPLIQSWLCQNSLFFYSIHFQVQELP